MPARYPQRVEKLIVPVTAEVPVTGKYPQRAERLGELPTPAKDMFLLAHPWLSAIGFFVLASLVGYTLNALLHPAYDIAAYEEAAAIISFIVLILTLNRGRSQRYK